jgi:enoyl-CoA hydratase/carnithine racemase
LYLDILVFLILVKGHNLKEFIYKNNDEEQQKNVFSEFNMLLADIRNLPIPVIAEVYGLAAAAGSHLKISSVSANLGIQFL